MAKYQSQRDGWCADGVVGGVPVPFRLFRLGGIACLRRRWYRPRGWNRPSFPLPEAAQDRCATIGGVKQVPHRTVVRRWDEPKLEVGDTISMAVGLVGVVLARYTRSGDARNYVRHIIELRGEAEEH